MVAFLATIDWLADWAQHIGFARIVETHGDFRKGPHVFGSRSPSVTLQVTKVLKGRPPRRIDRDVIRDRMGDLPHRGQEYMLFFDTDSTLLHAVDLEWKSWDDVYSSEGNVIRDRAVLVETIELRARKQYHEAESLQAHCESWSMMPLSIPAPRNTESYWTGGLSASFLIVPPDARYETLALDTIRSGRPYRRSVGIWWLARYPSEESEALLRALLSAELTDLPPVLAAADDSLDDDDLLRIRETAYSVLQTMCIDVPKPKGYRNDRAPRDCRFDQDFSGWRPQLRRH